jgi:hypothetical protein
LPRFAFAAIAAIMERRHQTRGESAMEDATRIGQTAGQTLAGSIELDTVPRPVVNTAPQAQRASRKSSRPLRIVATADNFLSAALLDLSPPRRSERRERLRAAFSAAVDCAVTRGAQLFVIAGNLFATPTPGNQDRAFVAAELARLRDAGVMCVAIGGGHDLAGAGARGDDAPYQLYESGDGLRFFSATDSLSPALCAFDGLRVALVGVSAQPQGNADPLASLTVNDPDDSLGRAEVAVLLVHALVEGLSTPTSVGDVVEASSVAALPSAFRLLIAGGAPRFGRAKIGPRDVVACGASERHSFDAPANSSGFAWIELTTEGVTVAEHVRIEEQPRVDVELTTADLFPGGAEADEDEADETMRSGVHLLPVLTPEEIVAAGAENDDEVAPYTPPQPDVERERTLGRIVETLTRACRPDTMTRLRLTGPLTRRQFRRLPLAEALRFGRRESFAFELDATGLTVEEPAPAEAPTRAGPGSPARELDLLVAEYRARIPVDERDAIADIDAAAGMLQARLRTATDREAAR